MNEYLYRYCAFPIFDMIKGLCLYTALFVVITLLLRSYYVVSITNGVRSILVST